MQQTSALRNEIAEYASPHSNFLNAFIRFGDRYAAFYTSKYLIQDTADAVSAMCVQGFSDDPMRAYIELWGTLQALIIQQDAICELHRSITTQELPCPASNSAWRRICNLRNELAGHPAAQGALSKPKRTFLGRGFGTLDQITYEQYQVSSKASGMFPDIQYPKINLRHLIKDYDGEAAAILSDVLTHMKQNWP